MNALRNLRILFGILALLMIVGIVGYRFIEGWSWFDGLYMVLTTFTTIGYSEVHPLSTAGRVFNIFLIVTGVALVFLIIGALTQALIEFEFNQFFGRRRMQREISRLSGHYIICGAGRVGRSVARELGRKPAPFVVIEANQEKINKYQNDWLMIQGDATQEGVLRAARIEDASGLVAATTTDATNTYIILTARALNPKLKIIARASEEGAEKHMRTAGADSVMSPYTFAGYRIAHAFLRPNVVDLIEIAMTQSHELGLDIGEVPVRQESPFAGKTVRESRIRQDLDVIVLAIKRQNEPLRFNPKSDDLIHPGDQLVVMGEPARLRELEQMA
ncbi:MAG TPA: potassium channel protein [Clostridia bacterium]|nr:potassium channel protein [Clostridia bacterium]